MWIALLVGALAPMTASAQRSQAVERIDHPAASRAPHDVDAFIQKAVDPGEGTERIQARLRTLLAEQRPNSNYNDLPLAREIDLRAGHSLVVAYTVARPQQHDTATIRGYHYANERFELVATAGESDFDGFGMFKKELESPIDGEHWLLAWGQAHTYNGMKVRFRIYAFDGEAFRTVWAPDDMFDAAIRITGSRIAIDHQVRTPSRQVHSEYLLMPDGPVKVR